MNFIKIIYILNLQLNNGKLVFFFKKNDNLLQ